jgi:hypothetical protein
MKRTRRVFGRLWTTCPVTGKPVRIELNKDCISVRVKRSRMIHRLTLADLVTLTTGQGVFRL